MRPVTDRTAEPDLREYLRMLWRRRRVIVLVAAAALVTAIVASLATPAEYEASATMVLQAQSSDPFTDTTVAALNPDRIVQTEVEVFDSSAVSARVEDLIGASPGVSVSSLGQTNTFSVTAKAPEAAQAADIANAYAQAYVDVTRDQALSDIRAAMAQLRAKVDDLGRQIAALDARGNTAGSASERDSLVSNQALFQQKLDQLQISSSLQQGRASISAPAEPPADPFRPQPIRSAVLALIIGLILGLATVLLLDYLDDSITSTEGLERALGDRPVFATIPLVATSRKGGRELVQALDAPRSPAAEAYRSLRTSVQFVGLDLDHSVIQVTSPSQGDGKTTTAVNLAVSLALGGHRTCLSCCDLRRPRVHELLGLSGAVGLTSVITKQATLDAAIQAAPGVEGLDVLPAGPVPPNPAEVLASRHVRAVIDELRGRYDYVVLDCPPLLPVSDAVALAPVADVVLVVVRAGATRTNDVVRATETLRQVRVEPAGGVLNAATAELGGYGYGYGYGQTSNDDEAAVPAGT